MKQMRRTMPWCVAVTALACVVPAWAGEVKTDDLRVYQKTVAYGQASFPGAAPTVSTNNAKLTYTFSTNTTPVTDESGNGNTGTVSGAVWTNGSKIGGGYVFDGTDDYIQAADAASLDIQGAISICAWIKSSKTNGAQMIVAKHDDSNARAYNLYFNGREVICQLSSGGTGGTVYEFKIVDGLVSGVWMHVTMTWDGTANANGKIYLDGVAQTLTTQTTGFSGTNIYNSAQPFRVGSKSNGGNYFSGQIDDVRVYARELSSQEVHEIYDLGPLASVTNYSFQVASAATFSGTTTITRIVKQGDVDMGVYTNGP